MSLAVSVHFSQYQCKVRFFFFIGGFLFITDQQFAKTVEKRVRDLNDPTAGPEVRVAFQFLLFLAASMFAGILYPLLDEVPQYDTGYLPTV